MAITRLALENFTVFEKADFEFVPGVNVLLGANGTGKTHSLKAMYALVHALKGTGDGKSDRRGKFGLALLEKLETVFRPDRGNVGRLIRRGTQADAQVELGLDDGPVRFSLKSENSFTVQEERLPDAPPAVYLPTREILALYEGFVGLYSKYQTSFDSTYYDACVALNTPPLKKTKPFVTTMLRTLEKVIGGRVTLEGERFYVEDAQGSIEAPLVAEGLRKLATLLRLMQNGSIEPGSVLFWDEPEANLNPALVGLLVEILTKLAEQKVQIFLATHDFLLSQRLSLESEYQRTKASIRFFLLHRKAPESPIEIAAGRVLAELPPDPIQTAFLRHYDYERQLFVDAEEPRK